MTTLALAQTDSGRSVEAKPDDTIVITLAENPTTGFRWAVDQIDERVLALEQADYVTLSDASGGGGVRTFTLKPVQPGSAQFRLKLWREWEGAASIRDRFEVMIRVI